MISNVFLSGIIGLIHLVIEQLPSFDGLPSGLVTAFNFFGPPVAGACSFVPGLCSALAYIVPTSLGIGFIVAVFYSIAWIFHWRQ